MLFKTDHFDQLREQLKTLPDLELRAGNRQVLSILRDLIDGQEKLYRKLTETPVDITKHDEHGRVKL